MREALRASWPAGGSSAAGVLPNKTSTIYTKIPMIKKRPPWLLTVSSQWAHGELTVSSAVTESWPGPWLSRDLAVTEPWSYWRCRDWAVTEPWLSCDPAVTELWPCRDWAVTSPSRDWAVIIGPGAVTTVVTVSSPWAHGDNYFLMGIYVEFKLYGTSSEYCPDSFHIQLHWICHVYLKSGSTNQSKVCGQDPVVYPGVFKRDVFWGLPNMYPESYDCGLPGHLAVMRVAMMEPGAHTMSDELILQTSCNICLAFK